MTGWPLKPSRGGIFTVTFGQKTGTEELRTAPWMKMDGSGGIAPRIWTSALDWGEWLVYLPTAFIRVNIPLYPSDMRRTVSLILWPFTEKRNVLLTAWNWT